MQRYPGKRLTEDEAAWRRSRRIETLDSFGHEQLQEQLKLSKKTRVYVLPPALTTEAARRETMSALPAMFTKEKL